MATSYNDAQAIWPVSGDSLNCSTLGIPILPNTTMTRVCGLRSNRTIAERCCGSVEVRQYQCWLYCEHSSSINKWGECISGNSTTSDWGAFCQGNIASNITESLASPSTSFAFRSSAPKFGWMVFMLIATFLFIGPAQAFTVPSLGDGLAKRQSDSGCTLTIDRNYTSLQHSTRQVSSHYVSQCGKNSGCGFGFNIVTPLTENNRTLNGTSASEPEFDAFFDAVSNATSGRKFPALSSANLSLDLIVPDRIAFTMGWTPISVSPLTLDCRTIHGFTDFCTVLCQWHGHRLQ